MKQKIQPKRTQTLRYFVVILVGLMADLSIAFVARQFLQLPLTISSAIGLLCAVGLNYSLFEYWVYSTKRFSIGRLVKTYAASLFTLGIRVLVILAISRIAASSPTVDFMILIAAVGVSFVMNFVLVQFIFQPSSSESQDKRQSPLH